MSNSAYEVMKSLKGILSDLQSIKFPFGGEDAQDGGKGSGNYGHKGREGKVGGSGEGASKSSGGSAKGAGITKPGALTPFTPIEGSATSGNHGHGGRPGSVGGSTKGGGHAKKAPDPLRPDTLAGVKLGKPMQFDKADGGNVNPKFRTNSDYQINCQSCVVVYEARLRGYDVEALPNRGNTQVSTLRRDSTAAFLDPKKKNVYAHQNYIDPINNDTIRTAKQAQKYLEDTVKPGERYHWHFEWRGRRSAHIVSLDRNDKGELRVYDPQNGKIREKPEEIYEYLKLHRYSRQRYGVTIGRGVTMIRVDNVPINENIFKCIAKEVGT